MTIRKTIDCPQCFKRIAPKARKCLHCDSILDWRRFLNIGTTGFALIAAVASTATFAYNIINEQTIKNRSNVDIRFEKIVAVTDEKNEQASFDSAEFQFYAINLGNRSGLILNLYYISNSRFECPKPNKPIIVDPGDFVLVKCKFSKADSIEYRLANENIDHLCRFSFVVANPDGSEYVGKIKNPYKECTQMFLSDELR